jgi:SOS-response transcriptional repressor LexA
MITTKTKELSKPVYEFIISTIVSQHRGPTVREIQNKFDLSSTSMVNGILRRLERLGHIRRSGKSRGIRVVGLKVRRTKRVRDIEW